MSLDQAPSPAHSSYAAPDLAARALEHCRVLCEQIGPRPSCGAGEKAAADYALQVLADAALDARRELILSQRSAYRPFSLAIASALLAHALGGRSPLRRALGTMLSAAAALAFAREAGLQENWTHRLLKPGDSQNIVAVIPAQEPPANSRNARRIVLCAHIDSHRTPIFYSHPLWLKLFSPIIALTFASLAIDVARHALARPTSSRIGKLHILLQSISLALTLQADSTPHNAGANDNASGAAVVLALAEKLAQEPLENCEVWIAMLGCEEVGAHGMRALLRRHGKYLQQASVLNFDMVGIGTPAVLESEGLLLKVECDPHLRAIAFQVAEENRDLLSGSHAGPAYTDAAVARNAGISALTIDSLILNGHPAQARGGYWHQSEDTFDKIEPECLGKAAELGWKMLQRLDQQT